jgi:hypothetical protein
MALGVAEAVAIGSAFLIIILLLLFTDVAGNVDDTRGRKGTPRPVRAAAPPLRSPRGSAGSGGAGGAGGAPGSGGAAARAGVSSLFSRRRAALRGAAAEQLPGGGLRMEKRAV